MLRMFEGIRKIRIACVSVICTYLEGKLLNLKYVSV